MDEDSLNMSVRKFLKVVGVTSQREIEKAVRDAESAGRLAGVRAHPGEGAGYPRRPGCRDQHRRHDRDRRSAIGPTSREVGLQPTHFVRADSTIAWAEPPRRLAYNEPSSGRNYTRSATTPVPYRHREASERHGDPALVIDPGPAATPSSSRGAKRRGDPALGLDPGPAGTPSSSRGAPAPWRSSPRVVGSSPRYRPGSRRKTVAGPD